MLAAVAGPQAGAGGNGNLAGVLPVFQTPFDDRDRIDYPALEKLFDWVFANGADGVAFAMVSEILRMSSQERDEVAAVACRLSRGRGSCVISVGAESLAAALCHARHAAESGADAVMATPAAAARGRRRRTAAVLHDDRRPRGHPADRAGRERLRRPATVSRAAGPAAPRTRRPGDVQAGGPADRPAADPAAQRHRRPGQGLRGHRGPVPDRQLPPRGDRHHAGQRRGVGAVRLVACPRRG